jgi:hypothetical protein
MRLDSAAISALNLLPNPREDRNKESSVHGVLDRTVTRKLGSRLLAKWLRQPLLDEKLICQRQDQVQVGGLGGAASATDVRARQTLYDRAAEREEVRGVLQSVPDLDQLSMRFEKPRGAGGHVPPVPLCAVAARARRGARQVPRRTPGRAPRKAGPAPRGGGLWQVSRCVMAAMAAVEPDQARAAGLVESVLDFDLAPREFLVRPEHDATGELQGERRCEHHTVGGAEGADLTHI